MTLPNTADAPALSTERVSDLVQKLVAAATAEVEAAAQRTRAQAQIEITQLHRTIDLLREEVQAEHDKLTIAERDLTRARASASQLKEELDRERAEKARIAATLETVRLLVSGPEADQQESEPMPLPAADVAEAHDELTATEAGAESDDSADFPAGDLMSRTAIRDAAAHADGTGYLAQLLGQIEEIYRSDLESAEGTSDVVARLAANLSYARDAFARRVEAAEDGDAALFDREIARLLEARSGTPFGRHLAMAIRSASGDRGTVIEFQKERS
jgi:hypothetical protein